jgi:hypothetical protein
MATDPGDVRSRALPGVGLKEVEVTDTTGTTEYTNHCTCGWEVTGPLDDVVDATIDHGRRIHNMEATRDEVIAALLGPDASEAETRASA